MLTTFTDRMNSHWTQTLGLAGSKALTEGWQQLVHATDRINAGAKHWQVLQLPTGSGKTEALKVLCSVQDQLRHPGVLIVTKFQDDADKIAEGINKLSGWPMARAVHKKAPAQADELGFTPVLVTTHAAYRLALQELADLGQSDKWDRLRAYNCGNRAWLIIDEAFDWSDAYSVNIGNLRAMSGDLSGALADELRTTGEQLRTLAISLTDIEKYGSSDRVLTVEQFDVLARLDLDGLQSAVAGVPDDVFAEWIDTVEDTECESGTRTGKPSKSSKVQYLDLMGQLLTVVRIGHGWISNRGGKVLLHSSRSLIKADGMRGVILDATADIDPTYSLMRHQVHVLPRPHGVRCYKNVTLHVSYGHKVGKDYLAQNAAKEWPILWGDLKTRLAGKRVLVCAHKQVLPTIDQYRLTNGTVRFANWGRLDGKNDWDTCEAAVLFGLPYLDDIAPAETFIAHRGPQSSDWFEGNRAYEGHADIRSVLKYGFISRSVVQAINRVLCRKAIDEHGNCAPTDIYLMLPNGKTGECVVRDIEEQMPGIRTKGWNVGAAKKKARKAPTEAKLIMYFEGATSGPYLKSDLARTLRINPSSLERATAKLRNRSSVLAQKFDALGVHYHSQSGRGKEAFFTKH